MLNMLPAFKLIYMGCIEPSFQWSVPHLFQLSFDKVNHLFWPFEVGGKFTVLVAVAAIFRTLAAVGVRAACAGILIQRHTAALTESVESSHSFYD